MEIKKNLDLPLFGTGALPPQQNRVFSFLFLHSLQAHLKFNDHIFHSLNFIFLLKSGCFICFYYSTTVPRLITRGKKNRGSWRVNISNQWWRNIPRVMTEHCLDEEGARTDSCRRLAAAVTSCPGAEGDLASSGAASELRGHDRHGDVALCAAALPRRDAGRLGARPSEGAGRQR